MNIFKPVSSAKGGILGIRHTITGQMYIRLRHPIVLAMMRQMDADIFEHEGMTFIPRDQWFERKESDDKWQTVTRAGVSINLTIHEDAAGAGSGYAGSPE